MNPFICGAWDGVSFWMQWDDDAPAGTGYRVRYRLKKAKPGADWLSWVEVQARSRNALAKIQRPWIVVPTNAEGASVMAQVAVQGSEDWMQAGEVTFLRSTCAFEIASVNRTVQYAAGTRFYAVVDGASCGYRLLAPAEVRPGDRIAVTMEAVHCTGWCQLDYAGHFVHKPSLGLTIQNTAPSENDISPPTGRDFTQITRAPEGCAVAMTFSGRNNFSA